jgi:hypothetical protein
MEGVGIGCIDGVGVGVGRGVGGVTRERIPGTVSYLAANAVTVPREYPAVVM